jgi:hypothetical protein
MNTKTKSIVVLIGVFIIGIIIGAFGSSLLTHHMWRDRVSRFRTLEGFTERILNKIDPAPDKREAVKNVLIEEYRKLNHIYEQSKIQVEMHTDSVLAELKPLLSEEQFERARHFLKRRPPRIKRPPEGKSERPPRDD